MRSSILTAASSLKECSIPINGLILFIATLFIFFFDLHLPLGVAAATPYVLVIFASLWISGIQFTYFVAALSIILTVVGFYHSPGIILPMNIVLFNRGLTLLLIICSTVMVIKIKKTNIDMSALLTQTLIDPITGQKNRQAFESELDTEILRCERYHRNLSVAIIDIDHFKLFSNSHDRQYSNDLIKRISTDIKTNIRTSDLFYHIDTDVFAILFPETELSEAKEVCEAIRKKISTKMEKEHTITKITTSIGIAMLGHNDSKIDLCKRAEDALLISKSNGKNLVSTLPEVTSKDKSHVAAILSRSRSDG